MLSIVQVEPLRIHQGEIGFVDQDGCLKCVPGPLLSHECLGLTPELRADVRFEFLERRAVS